MTNFLHSREPLKDGETAILSCDTQCNFMLMTDSNFNNYKNGRKFEFFGGHFKTFPARITAPNSDNWNVVIDVGGGDANIKYSLSYITKQF